MIVPERLVEDNGLHDGREHKRERIHGMAHQCNQGQDKVQARKTDGRKALVDLWVEGDQRGDQEQSMGGDQVSGEWCRHGLKERSGHHADLSQDDQEGQDSRDGSNLAALLWHGIQLGQEQGTTDRHASKESEKDKPPGRSPCALFLVVLLHKTLLSQRLALHGPAGQGRTSEEKQLT